MGDPRERNYQSLFSELAGYEKKGVYMLMNGVPASPMQIVQAHIVREDAVYMQDWQTFSVDAQVITGFLSH